MLQVLDNVELEEVDWPWLCVEGDHGLESLVPVRVLRLRSREKEKVQCLEHLVRKRDVDNLVVSSPCPVGEAGTMLGITVGGRLWKAR